MSAIKVRPFHRSDREQLTGLVNAHAGAVLPGMSASASTVLSALERQPGEFIEDPWVSERLTLVAWQGDRIAAAAHLLRYFPDERAGAAVRDAGEIHWLVFWPEAPARNPHWPDATEAAEALIAACIGQLEQWGVARQHAGGNCPSAVSTGPPSSGRTSARSMSGPDSPTSGTRRSSTWPGSATCGHPPRLPSQTCPRAARPG